MKVTGLMLQFLSIILRNFVHDQRGVTLVEYGIALTLAVTVGAAGLIALGEEIGGATAAAGGEMPD